MFQAINNAERTYCPPLQNDHRTVLVQHLVHLGAHTLSLVRWLRRRIHDTPPPPELAHAMHHVTRCTLCSIIRGPSQCSWALRCWIGSPNHPM